MRKIHPFKVFYRVFPEEDINWDVVQIEDNVVLVEHFQEVERGEKYLVPFWEFRTDGVFLNNTQDEVFETITNDIPGIIREGVNSVIIAFGQTGAGKTFTISNLNTCEEDLGIIPKIMEKIFKIKNTLPPNTKMAVQMTYLEFSPVVVCDLLKEYPNYVKNWDFQSATKVKVSTADQALKLIYLAEGRKNAVRENNYWSNIFTSVCTFYVDTKNFELTNNKLIESRLHIVDMAGVDTVGNSSSKMKSRKDVGNANVTMAYMEQYFMKLVTNDKVEKSQRTDPLLHFLSGDMSQHAVVRLIGHIKMKKKCDLTITLSMLRFGQVVKNLKPTVREMVIKESLEAKLKRLQMQHDEIKRERLQNSILLNQDEGNVLNEEQVKHVRKLVKDYFKTNGVFKILNVEDAILAFKLFRDMCTPLQSMKQKESSSVPSEIRFSSKFQKSRLKKVFASASEVADAATQIAEPMHGDSSLKDKPKDPAKKRSKAGSTIGKKSKSTLQITTKKVVAQDKSSNDASNKESDFYELMEHLPSNEEVWKMFTEEPVFKKFMEDMNVNNNNLKEAFVEYQKKVQELIDVNEELERKRKQMSRVNIYVNANLLKEYDNSKNVDINLRKTGYVFQNEVNTMKEIVQSVQEEVLFLQSCLMLHLDVYKNLQLQIDNEFKVFCIEKYRVPLPLITLFSSKDVLDAELDMEIPIIQKQSEKDKQIETVQSSKAKLTEFYEMMNRERIKHNKAKIAKQTAWK